MVKLGLQGNTAETTVSKATLSPQIPAKAGIHATGASNIHETHIGRKKNQTLNGSGIYRDRPNQDYLPQSI